MHLELSVPKCLEPLFSHASEEDILEDVDENSIPDTLVERLQEEKWVRLDMIL